MKTFQKEYQFPHTTRAIVWDALTNAETMHLWDAGPAKMSPEKNFQFSLWGGDIHGKNLEVMPQEKLVQEWYTNGFTEPSEITLTLSESAGNVIVSLVHKNIPEELYDEIANGWDTYYFGAIQEYLKKKKLGRILND